MMNHWFWKRLSVFLIWGAAGALGLGIVELIEGYREGTVGKEQREQSAHRLKCTELRVEFFRECQKTMTRQQCEALYGQTRGNLFDYAPDAHIATELFCDYAESPWSGR